MKRTIYAFLLSLTALALLAFPAIAADTPVLTGRAHVQDIGWQDVSEGTNHLLLGTVGQGKRVEAFTIQTDYPGLGISYQAHVQNYGWQDPVGDGQLAGTEGQGLRVEAFTLNLTGEAAPNFTVYYRTHVENYGWLDWATAGPAGTTNHAYRCEALEVLVLPAGEAAPGRTTTPCIQATTRDEMVYLRAVNALRAAHGLAYVTSDGNLKAVADLRVNELVSQYSHIRPNGQLYETAVKDVFPNYPKAGGGFTECILFGPTSVAEPNRAFQIVQNYPHEEAKFLDPAVKYVAFANVINGTMGYTNTLLSGLDRIDFADY